MGTALFPATEALLVERFRRILLMLDGDPAGRQASERIAAQPAGKCCLRQVTVPAGRQPDQLNEAEIAALLAPDFGHEGDEVISGWEKFDRRKGEFSTGLTGPL